MIKYPDDIAIQMLSADWVELYTQTIQPHKHVLLYASGHHKKLLCPAVGQEPIEFILPEFVSYLEERGVLCVGNG